MLKVYERELKKNWSSNYLTVLGRNNVNFVATSPQPKIGTDMAKTASKQTVR
jgi:hypothetical protein